MKLLKDRILVKKLAKKENKTESGIFTGGKLKSDNDFEVLIIGNEVKNIKVGDTVRKFEYANPIEIEYEGKKCFILSESADIEFVL